MKKEIVFTEDFTEAWRSDFNSYTLLYSLNDCIGETHILLYHTNYAMPASLIPPFYAVLYTIYQKTIYRHFIGNSKTL